MIVAGNEETRRVVARRRSNTPRSGVAIIVVLGVISISLAVSYAMLRWQGAALEIQQNARRLSDARGAAMSGMSAAIGAIHGEIWQGIDVPLAGTISADARYAVTFLPGDPRLTTGAADSADWPYRVTVTATGYATAGGSGGVSTHQIRAVLRLQPERLNAAPQVWPLLQPYTVYHWSGNDFIMQTPARITGPVYINGRLKLCDAYPSYDVARYRYLSDLNHIRNQSGRRDDRPFDGPIDWSKGQTGTTTWLVTQLLGLTTSELKSSYTNDFGTPKNADSYRFYLGGPVYDIPRVESVLEKVSLTPDAKTNPLGIYYRDGGLEIRNDVQITGTLIVRESVFISGRNVQLQASPFRGVGQPATATRFPALVALDDITLSSDCGVRIVGTVLAGDRFHVNDGLDSVSVSITGRVVAGRVQIEGRWPWYLSESTWKSVYDAFRLQLMLDPNNRVDHFPDFLAILGRSSQPRIKIEPATASEVIDHWQAVDGPVYQPVATGQGMKWDVIDWTEQPNQTAP